MVEGARLLRIDWQEHRTQLRKRMLSSLQPALGESGNLVPLDVGPVFTAEMEAIQP